MLTRSGYKRTASPSPTSSQPFKPLIRTRAEDKYHSIDLTAEVEEVHPEKRRKTSAPATNLQSQPLTFVVGVGDDAQMFYSHKDIVAKQSDFFSAMTKNGWKEAATNAVRLPEDHPEHFKIFAQSLCRGRVESPMLTGSMHIIVTTLIGKAFTLEVQATANVTDVFEMIENRENIPRHMQRLIYAGK
ncbi:hypothetical protein DOTSEDRAFT_19073 [Dothistroma septosporum NZE10]|uniref:BTB domain-containing protein n=1 Tax=Dothistroma septosporum (strain NZE10 / CBS 128990) TaxID=675120 RepID=N1Q249_DOTSN|nr:hypothetical protein DOTSEDRAFT_19073 [Dothistroma septosporum NZE10]